MRLMENFKSLADFLGVQDLAQLDKPVAQAPSPKMTRKAFCREILATREHRESLLRRIVMDTLPAAVECMLYHYADGKPTEHLEVKDTSNRLEDMTVEQLESRALLLADVARRMRTADPPGEGQIESVH